jgi:hypothetical protein
MLWDPSDDGLTLEDLGPGWEQVDRALADIQADFSRTVSDAPKLLLLWRELDVDRDGSDAMAAVCVGPGARIAFVGKSRDWYHGASGGFVLEGNYPSAVLGIADQLSDAVVDTFLGYREYWPHCPTDDHLLTVLADVSGRCWWACIQARHIVAEVGQLSSVGDDQ